MAWNLDDERRRRRRHIRGRLVMVTAIYTSAAKRNRFAVCAIHLSADRWRDARDRWKRRNAVASLHYEPAVRVHPKRRGEGSVCLVSSWEISSVSSLGMPQTVDCRVCAGPVVVSVLLFGVVVCVGA